MRELRLNFCRTGARLVGAAIALSACAGHGDETADSASDVVVGAAARGSSFGLSTSADMYTVDTGAGLVFKVRRTDDGASTRSPGDIASLVFEGVDYQNPARGSQINSGFDYLYKGLSTVTVSAAQVSADVVKITVVAGDLTHYYLARRGYPHIYMATHFATEPDTLNMCRYIVRIPSSLLPNGPAPSDIRGTTSTVEASDVFALPGGETRSKHYSGRRAMDWTFTGATGRNVGVFMVRDNAEGGSGGPFYRSLINQAGADQEIYNITNYGEGQTEALRTGRLNGPYTLVFTHGEAPPTLDTSWVAGAGLKGYVGAAGRGRVTGVGIDGRDPRYAYTVGLSNAAAQYWATASASTGYYNLAGVLPGTYGMTIYKNELAVDTREVSVAAGGTTLLNTLTIAGDPSAKAPLWRIGDWDGTPNEFLNADKVTTMHPSDPRIATWTPGPFVVGVSAPSRAFPCYQWKDMNNPVTIEFDLTAFQIAARTVRVGITAAFSGGRPTVRINGWSSPSPGPSRQPASRTLTVGTYRGNNTLYTFDAPASAFVVGKNTMTLTVISGSGGTKFLSAGVSYDSVDLF